MNLWIKFRRKIIEYSTTMAVSEYHLDTRIRRRHIPLITQQRRLRHLRSLSARNVTIQDQNLSKEFGIAFTLHKKLDSPAFYSSEVIFDNLNPSWKDFESSNFPENVDVSSSYVIVRVWDMTAENKLLIEWAVFFTGLVYLGEQIPKEGKNFKPNTLVFGMSEGYYGCSDSYQHPIGNASDLQPKENLEVEVASLRTSYTLSTLSRIKTVERAIKQTQAAVQKRCDSIRRKLQSFSGTQGVLSDQELLRIRISVLQTELQFQQSQLRNIQLDLEGSTERLFGKQNEIQRKAEEQKQLVEKCLELSKCHTDYREMVLKTEAQLNFRRKGLITELSDIYPIVEFPDGKGYSIHNVHLPNSENFAGHDDMMIAVALGYVCHFVMMISQFLNVPLRYSIHFYGSRSTITDHISSSLPDKTREFPLHNKNKDRRCFEYGVFLLNKNIAQLRILGKLTTRDLSATLPNLSNLIELKFSNSSDSLDPILSKDAKLPSPFAKPAQNGLASASLKVSDSEMELLRQEMAAMIPSGHKNGLLPPLKVTDASALSSSLDKGLNDILALEQNDTETVLAPKPTSALLLRQSSHHSSYPNLNASLKVKDLNDHLLATPPKVWTAESSRTNSEEEAEDVAKAHQSVVLNDSIFYIPSVEEMVPRPEPATETNGDFSADLSLRAEKLANQNSSFQMQRLKSSSTEEEYLTN
ncbi:hypothetical protein JTE90_000765 [Oedothorax gibbosus]|uniref:UV radiation resistance-associated gene protein n=1 Tax=Oedothorax gibbosus TaxID=931172 RepID=A0AAV6UNM0_9ARAC|nr:hypothetical protein JTE90_000765 [Oedothorax gibbosus]